MIDPYLYNSLPLYINSNRVIHNNIETIKPSNHGAIETPRGPLD